LVQLYGGSGLTLYRTTFQNSPNFHILLNRFRGITSCVIRILTPRPVYSVAGYALPPDSTPATIKPATCLTPHTVNNTDGFEHICMRHEAHPLVFDTYYSDKSGPLLPDFRGIVVRDFHYVAGGRFGAGTSIFRGYRSGGTRLPIQVTIDGAVFDGATPKLSG